MDAEEIRSHPAFDERWFYKLELAPGLYTPGPDRAPTGQTRELLRRVEVEGARCLDIGTQEAMIPALLERRGGSVVAYDRVLREARLGLVKEALGLGFETVGGMKLQDLPAALGHPPFDLVIFSGVLYHMFDPLGGLATARGMVRNGGICIVETACVFDDSGTMHFNESGRFTPNALWFITPRLLDYLLRFLRLVPLDAVHLGGKGSEEGKPAQGRIAVSCRAVSDAGDEWAANRGGINFAEFLDWPAVASDAPPVGYDGGESIDLQEAVQGDPLEVGPEQARLDLAARF